MEITRKKNNLLLQFLKSNITILILLLMIAAGAVFTDSFLTLDNLMNVFRQVSVNGVLAAGFTMVILADGFDLSMGSILSACAVIAVGTLNASGSTLAALLAALAVGCAFGVGNGALIHLIRGDASDSYLVTLGMSLAASGVAYLYSDGYIMYCDPELTSFREIARGTLFGIPNLLVIMFAVLIIFQFILKFTPFGRKFYMVGANRVASYYSGINSYGIKTASFIFSGLCAGLGAVMVVSRSGGAGPMAGVGYEFDAAIATIIGGNREGRISTSMVKTLIGVLIFGLISNIMNLMGYDSTIQKVVKGIILLIALYTDRFRKEAMD